MKKTIIGAAGLVLLSLIVSAPQPLAAPSHNSCASLTALKLPDTTITSAEEVTGGALTPRGFRELTGLPAFCRVAAVTRPAVKFEVWLPLDTWNGKFQGVGNGANAGTIGYAAMVTALKRGYATASTDTGHQTENARDGAWAIGHPELVADFGYRAIHRDGRERQADRRHVLPAAGETLVLRGVLDGRSPGADGGAALSGGLRRHHRGRAGRELVAIPDRRAHVGGGCVQQGS